MTIAQYRAREVRRLAAKHEDNPSPETIRRAARLMGSYYRLAGLDDRLLHMTNDPERGNSRYTKAQEERAYKWYKRLSAEFTEFCGYHLEYFGHIASIVDQNNSREISTYFYN